MMLVQAFAFVGTRMLAFAQYDNMESARLTFEGMGAAAKTFWSYPVFRTLMSPVPAAMSSWGQVTERSFSRMVVKPDWGIDTVVSRDREYLVDLRPVLRKPFCDLLKFHVRDRKPHRQLLLAAPMSGHYATLLRKTVVSLLPDCDIFVTDWHNARDIPVSAGKFDVEDFTKYLVEFMRHLGRDTHVVAVCQPAPLALAATAIVAKHFPHSQPRSLTLIGGPVDPDAAATEVTDFGKRVTMGQLEHLAVQRVGVGHAGVGRLVYPGLVQLGSFISMNLSTHFEGFVNQVIRTAKGEATDHDRHNVFYDEYLAVMDMTAEFYLSTVQRIFKSREIARNEFHVDGQKADIARIRKTAVNVVEGANDDISAPGQCAAALDLLTGLPDSMKARHLEPGAGHYGIFAGKPWLKNIRPLVMDFIDGCGGTE